MSEHELETQVKWLWEHHHEDFSDIIHWAIVQSKNIIHHFPGEPYQICFYNVHNQVKAFLHALDIETVENFGRSNNTMFKFTEEHIKLFRQIENQLSILKDFDNDLCGNDRTI